MNENKKGKKYKFPDSFILVIGHIKVYLHLPYRQTEGIIKATIGKSMSKYKQPPAATPSYSQICRRTNKLDVDINSGIVDDDVIIAADSTGIKVTNRGQWMQDKWNVKKQERLSKIYVAVDVKTKEIIALEVTDEKVHDGKVMKQLIEQILNNNRNVKIKYFIGDGAYDSNENFKYLQKKRIWSIIKVKRNSIISSTRITRYAIEKLDFKQRIITNGRTKRKYVDNDGWLKQHFHL